MSYKSDFQANNIDLQAILDAVNSLPDKINLDQELNTQENLLNRIQDALKGDVSGEIGVFTTDYTDDAKFLFIKGMTFEEFYKSKMNVYQLDSEYGYLYKLVQAKIDGRDGYTIEDIDDSIWLFELLSVDGTESGIVTNETLIEEIEYATYAV